MKTLSVIILAAILGLATGVGTAVMRMKQAPWDGNPGGNAVDPPLPDLPAPDELMPKVVVDQPKFDFGTMDLDDTGSHDFVFSNQGPGELVLTRGRVSCGCLVPDFKEDRILVMPGGSATITVTWEADQRVGPYLETAEINTNDSTQRKVELTISGEIAVAVQTVPAGVLFGRISAGETVTLEVPVYCYLEKPPLKILGHSWARKSIADHFELEFLPLPADRLMEEPDAKSGRLLRVTVKPGLPLGPIQQRIFLRTNLESATAVEVPIEGTVGRDITIAGRGWSDKTGVLEIGSVSSQEEVRWKLILIARGPHHKEVEFKPGQSVPNLLEVELGQRTELPGGKSTQIPLTVRIPAGSPRGNHLAGSKQGKTGQILIQTTHPNIPQLRIFVSFAIVD